MRPILVVAILLLGLNGAAPESKYQDSALATGENPPASAPDEAPSIGKADRELVLAVPLRESSDAAHDQDEATAEPPQSPALASTDADTDAEADADANVAESLDDLCIALLTSAQNNDLPVPFFANLIWQESRLKHDAVSKVGALGIAQFMPGVAIEAGLADPFDPRQAIPASARFLHTLREHFGNLGFVAAAYNAGAHRVGQWLDHRRALPQETRTYVLRVTGRSAEAWRKSPRNDSELTFVRHLPCRGLPAFADLEQAQLRDARQVADAQQSQPQPQQAKVAAKVVQKGRQKFARKLAPKTGTKIAQKIEKKAPIAHLLVAAGKTAPKVARSATTAIMARNFHAKHEATHPQRPPHEKRRVAEETFMQRVNVPV
jgi:soluble lytic murein transglycosylase-like protein